jgi:hypothetical protein
VRFLGSRERSVDPDPYRADPHRTQERDDELAVIPDRGGDSIPWLYTEGQKGVRRAIRRSVEFCIAVARVPTNEGLFIGSAFDDWSQQICYGLG